MPYYTYQCRTCSNLMSDVRTIPERHDSPQCYKCRGSTQLVLDPVRGIVKDPAVPKGPDWRNK